MKRGAFRFLAARLGGWALLLLALVAAPCFARGVQLDLTGYQRDDGAITTHYRGHSADPYFAIKALLAARELGLDIAAPAGRWIDWMLARTNPGSSLYGRYCLAEDETWRQCQEADADDSLLALWLELLYVSAPAGAPLPPAWQKESERALAALEQLYAPDLGAYVVSPDLRVALLMDNCEVVAALRAVARQKRSRGDAAGARRLRRQAELAERGMGRLFRPKADGLLRHTSQSETEEQAFYPHATAHVYPLLSGLDSLIKKPAIDYKEWMRRYGTAWLNLTADQYPWGLVAQAALNRGDMPTVTSWVRRTAPLRHGARWNVLEEALWQGLSTRVASR